MNNPTNTTTDFQLCPSSASPQIFPMLKYHQKKPRKKRAKSIPIQYDDSIGVITKPKYRKKPDPSAPKITRPCSECGKKFWSWKALFGHMRCHPERQWRGINPPSSNLRHPMFYENNAEALMSAEEDHEVASCLLMLANGPDSFATKEGCDLDLNLPAAVEDDYSSLAHSSGLALDLTLGF